MYPENHQLLHWLVYLPAKVKHKHKHALSLSEDFEHALNYPVQLTMAFYILENIGKRI